MVGGAAGAFTLSELTILEVDATCDLPAQGGVVGSLTLYNVGFSDTLALDPNGHFSGSERASWSDGSELTVSIAGDIIGPQASGVLSTSGKLADGEGNFWECATGQTIWFATG